MSLSLAERLERCNWDMFWLPPDARVIDRPELLVVGCDRPLSHLNMVRRIRGSSRRHWETLVTEARAHMHPQRTRFFLTDTIDVTVIEAVLEHAGCVRKSAFEARIGRIEELEIAAPEADLRAVTTSAEVVAHEETMMMGFAMGTWVPTFLEHKTELCRGRQRRYLAYLDGKPVAAAGLDHFPEHSVVMLWGGCTIPGARGRGFYRALLRRRLEDARVLGATWAGLYARSDTSAPIVDALGFPKEGEGWYWGEPE